MTKPLRVVLLIVFVAVLFVSVAVGTVGAQTAPDCSTVSYNGAGTDANPYEVSNVDQLQCIEEQDLDANYVQVSDIDASGTSSWNGGKGFGPVGGFNVGGFNGMFDGQGHNITGLIIDRGSESEIGLFGSVGSEGTITNASIVDTDIKGGDILNVGSLVGVNTGTVSESYAMGTVAGSDAEVTNVGGLVGNNAGRGEDSGMVEDSHAAVAVSTGSVVGGLVGENGGGIIKDSYATGSVSGGAIVGGLVGSNQGLNSNATITDSYATGSVSGSRRGVGGLVGLSGGNCSICERNFEVKIESSYATGEVDGGDSGFLGGAGGLVGEIDGTTVGNSYSTGVVSGDNRVGGLIGLKRTNSTVSDSYWDVQSSGRSSSDGGTGLTTSEMTGSSATNNMVGFDFTATWDTVTNPDDYPILAWQGEDDGGFNLGDYRNNGVVDTGGLQQAINDFIQGNIGTGDLQAVINAFISS